MLHLIPGSTISLFLSGKTLYEKLTSLTQYVDPPPDWSPSWPASGPVPPPELFHAMGAWAALTGLVGGATNSLAIALFVRSTKVQK